MKEYLIVTNETIIYPANTSDLKNTYPNTSFPINLNLSEYEDWGVREVLPTIPDSVEGKAAKPTTPINIDGLWHQQWILEDIQPSSVPTKVTMRQARLALLQAGLLDQIEGALASIEDPIEKKTSEITWEYSIEVERTNPLVIRLTSIFGLSEEQVDNMFRQAIAL